LKNEKNEKIDFDFSPIKQKINNHLFLSPLIKKNELTPNFVFQFNSPINSPNLQKNLKSNENKNKNIKRTLKFDDNDDELNIKKKKL
jgi:hypothetical protein